MLVHLCDEIPGLRREQILDQFDRRTVLFTFQLDHKYHALRLLDVKLLRLVIHIDHEHIAEQDILHKIVPVKLLHISRHKRPNLADCQFSDHIRVLRRRFGQKDIFQFPVHIHLKEMTSRQHLALRHGTRKRIHRVLHITFRFKRRCHLLSLIRI